VMHCNRAAPEREGEASCGPYDLVVVPKERVHAEYFIVSAHGVVHVLPGQPSDCTPLADWLHQTLMYRVLSSMSVFKYYLHRKILATWRAGSKRAAFNACRRRLARNCLYAKPLFVPHLVLAHGLVFDNDKVRMLHIPGQCVTLHEFGDAQHSLRMHPEHGAHAELVRRQNEMAQSLEELAKVMSRAVEVDVHIKGATSGSRSRSKSLGQERRDARDQVRHRQIAREDFSMLGNCIRLMDYMRQAALAEVVLQDVRALCERVEVDNGDTHAKLFTVTVEIQAGEICLQPPQAKFKDVMRYVWEDAIKIADSVPALSADRSLGRYAQEWDCQTVGETLRTNRFFRDAKTRIIANIASQFAKAMAYAKETYEPHLRVHQYRQDADQSLLEVRASDPIRQFKGIESKIGLMTEFQQDLDAMRTQKVIGVLFVNGRNLKDSLHAIPEEVLGTLKHQLQILASEACDAACGWIDTYLQGQGEKTRTHAGSAQLLMVQKEANEIENIINSILAMYDCLKENKVRMAMSEQVKLDALLDKRQGLVKFVKEAELSSKQTQQVTMECKQISLELSLKEPLVLNTFNVMPLEEASIPQMDARNLGDTRPM